MSRADSTPGATYVSEDGNVSFDEAGYRLDSLGNRTYNNSGIWGSDKARYSKPVQDAIDKYTAEVAEYERQMQEFLAGLNGEPGAFSVTSGLDWQRNPAADYTTKLNQLRAMNTPRPGAWSDVSNWRTQGQPQAHSQPSYRVNVPMYQAPASQPQSPAGYGFPDYRSVQQLPPAVQQPAPLQVDRWTPPPSWR